MATKAQFAGASMALALNRDAIGNWLSGNDERSIRYVQLQNELLRALIADLKDRTSGSGNKLAALIESLGGDTHPGYKAFPPMGYDKVLPERSERVQGLWDSLTGLKGSPALKAQLDEAMARGEEFVTVKLSPDEAKELFAAE